MANVVPGVNNAGAARWTPASEPPNVVQLALSEPPRPTPGATRLPGVVMPQRVALVADRSHAAMIEEALRNAELANRLSGIFIAVAVVVAVVAVGAAIYVVVRAWRAKAAPDARSDSRR